MAKTKLKVPVAGSSAPLKQSLSGLAALRDQLPPGPATPTDASARSTATATVASDASVYTRAKKVVVRRERKGHGGKTVTRIEGLSGSPADLETVMREMKRALGCGATLDGSDLLIHGDQCDRVTAWLSTQGVLNLVRGN